MSWVRLDDNFTDHPKVVDLSDLAFRKYIEGLCYSARVLTDGFIPNRLAHTRAAKELVQAGLWTVADGGYLVHDYLAYNPPAVEVKERRRAAADRTKRWRDGKRDASRNASSDASGDASPTRPDPSRRDKGRVSEEPRAVAPPPCPSDGGGEADTTLDAEQVELNVASIREARALLRGGAA